jgi:hypothetical protein
MASEWITHVLKVSKDKGISYKEAMSVAKSSYKPKKGAVKAPPKKQEVKGRKSKLEA